MPASVGKPCAMKSVRGAASKQDAGDSRPRPRYSKKSKPPPDTGPWAAWPAVTCASCEQTTHVLDRYAPAEAEGDARFLTWYKLKKSHVGGGPDGCECGRCTRTRLSDKRFSEIGGRKALAEARAADPDLDRAFLQARAAGKAPKCDEAGSFAWCKGVLRSNTLCPTGLT